MLPSPPPPPISGEGADTEAEAEALPLKSSSPGGGSAEAAESSGGEEALDAHGPGTQSKSKRDAPLAAASEHAAQSWYYLGDRGTETHRQVIVMMAICTLCFFANGCEHGVATWLSSYGIKQRDLGEETMAIMTSNFWTAMSAGRIAWACFSGFVTSAWPSLFMNTLCCILSAMCMSLPSQAVLWSSAMGIGLGVASSFPAVSQPLCRPTAAPRARARARRCRSE